MNKWEVLSGLPPYGPAAHNFSATGQGKHREGYVIKFAPYTGDSWVGNFQRGLVDFDRVVPHPNGQQLIVVAGGVAYVVCPDKKQCAEIFGGQIIWTGDVSELEIVLFASFTDVRAVGKTGLAWRSRRISWDGMRNLQLDRLRLSGEAYSPLDKCWHPFHVDSNTGHVEGGSYP